MDGCVFCQIVAGEAPAEIVREWGDALAFVPLGPVTDGHVLVIPKVHVKDVSVDPQVSGAVMARASELAADLPAANVITSMGEAATQTVFHLHLHVIFRRFGDGLALPWDPQSAHPRP